jgi:phosphoribosyl-ATP pyrophosphohydrolase
VIEECGELLQAIIKMRRGKKHGEHSVVLEMCDLVFCLDFLARNMGVTKEEIVEHVNAISQRVKKKILEHRDDASQLALVEAGRA